MSITTYTELQTALQNWSVRGDTTFTARIPEYITMAEGWIAYGLDMGPIKVPPLRVRAMETTVSAATVAGTETVALPTRYLAMRNIYIDTDPKVKLIPVTPEQRIFERPYSQNARSRVFSVEGDYIYLAPIPNSSDNLSILYYQRFAPLTNGSDTNWLLINSPNTYVFGALYASALMTGNDNGQKWLAAFMGSVTALNDADRSDRYSGGALTMRSSTGTP